MPLLVAQRKSEPVQESINHLFCDGQAAMMALREDCQTTIFSHKGVEL